MNRRLIALASCLTLAACGGGKPAPQLYQLQARAPLVEPCKRGDTIAIAEANAGPGLDGARIVVAQPGGKQTFYQGVRWSAPVPQLLQYYWADSFERSGMFSTVATDDLSLDSRWLLETQLRDFEINQETAGRQTIRVRLSASLVDRQSHRVIVTIPLQAQRDASGKSMQQIVGLFDDAMSEVTESLLAQLRPRLARCR